MRFINATRRNGKRALGGLLLAMTVAVVAPAAAQAQAYYEITPRHSGTVKCLDVEWASQFNGAGLIQYSCNGGWNQQFSLHSTDSGYYKIVARHSGKCLEVKDWGGAGARIQQWTCYGSANQQFRRQYVGYGYYELIARHSSMCVDVAYASTANYAPINTWYCNGGTNQQFRFVSR